MAGVSALCISIFSLIILLCYIREDRQDREDRDKARQKFIDEVTKRLWQE